MHSRVFSSSVLGKKDLFVCKQLVESIIESRSKAGVNYYHKRIVFIISLLLLVFLIKAKPEVDFFVFFFCWSIAPKDVQNLHIILFTATNFYRFETLSR